MNTLPPKRKKKPIIPIPLILVVVFIGIILLWGQLTAVPGQRLTILHTNDLQGQLMPITEEVNGKKVEIGGFARIQTIIDSIKKDNASVILLDAGDTIQGTLFTRLKGGADIGRIMSDIGYDAVTIGEHDFDKGPEGLKEYIKSATYPFLAANIEVSSTSELKDLFAPYVVLNVKGLRIGVFGLITKDANIISNTGSEVKIVDPKNAARKVIDELKTKSDVIIALSHLGLTNDRELASNVNGIDIIIGGHSKTMLSAPVIVNSYDGKKVIIVQAKNQGRYVGKLEVAIKNNKAKLVEYKLIPVDEKIKPDAKLAIEIEELKKQLEKEAIKPVGETKVPLDNIKGHIRTSEVNVGNLFTESVKEAFPEADVVLQNSGGIRGDKIVPAGKLTMKEIWEWHPFENKIVLVTLSGNQLKEVLERSVSNLPHSKGTFLQVAGISYVVDLTGTPQELSEDENFISSQGDRVIEVKVNGKPLKYSKNYRVAINDYMLSGGDGFITFKKAKDVTNTNKSLTDVVVEYVKKHSPIDIKTDGRIKVKGGLLR